MDVRRFALKIKLTSRIKRVSIDAVQACGMFLRDGLRLRGQIVKGYCKVGQEVFVHYWVEDPDRVVYDISAELAKLGTPELENMEYELTTEKPEGEVKSDEHNDELFKLYLEEPKKFWQLVQRVS